MPLELICGTAGTGKSKLILERMKQHAQKGERAILIVPEQFSHVVESELIGAVGYLSSEIQATSFARLSARTLAETGKLRLAVDDVGKNMLMARVLQELSGKLTVFSGAWEKPGFLRVMLDLISDFKRAEVNGEVLLRAATEEDESPLLSQKLTELAMIYTRYDEVLNEHFSDSEDNVTKLARLIEERNLFRDTYIYVDGFFRFTANELDVVSKLLAQNVSLTVAMCCPKNAEGLYVFEPVKRTAARLCAIAREVGAEILPTIYLEEKHRFADSKELLHFESEFYRYPNAVYDEPTKDITLYAAQDPYTEVTHLAAQIRRAVCEDGLRFRDIAIIAGDMEQYQNLIKTIFPSYEISVFVDMRSELLSHPVMLMFFSLFRLLSGGFLMQDVIAYAKSGYAGLTQEEADLLENYALMGHIEKNDWLDDERFLKRASMVFDKEEDLSETDGERAKQMLELKDRLLSPVLCLKEKFAADRRANVRVKALFEFFEQIKLREKIEEQMKRLEELGERQCAEEYAEVYELLMNALEQMILCIGDSAIGVERMCAVLEAGFSGQSMGVIPSANDQVFFGDVSRSLVKNVRRLFVVGAKDGAFPPSAPAEGVLTDSERIRLLSRGLELAPDTKKMAFDNQFLVYQALHISTEKTSVSYPVSTMDGKSLRPSPLVLRMRKLFSQLEEGTDLLDEKPDIHKTVASKQSAYHFLLGEMAVGAEDDYDGLYQVLCESEEYKEKLKRAEEYRKYSQKAEQLSKENVRKLYGKELRGSVSRFEKFASCPFSYFVRFGLKAKERKVLEIDTPDIGTLLHNAMEAFSKQMDKTGKNYRDITKNECEEMIEKLLSEMLERTFLLRLYSEKKMAVLFSRLKKTLMKSVWVICEHIRRGEFEPIAYEVSFDENGDMPPLNLELPTGEKLTIIGRIDRIDRYTDGTNLYLRIIDYKSGNKEFRLSDVYQRLSLQLSVYLSVACENGEELFGHQPKPAGMFYFRLTDPVVEASTGKAESLEEEILKKYKMSGLVLSDMDIVRAMDQGVTDYSKVIPVRIAKDGTLSGSQSKSATMEQMDKLKKYMKRTLTQIGQEILSGTTNILPYRKGTHSGCDFCEFKSICGFDPSSGAYRYLPQIADEVVWERMDS
ncbi:MAG: helicase-exonuclease AddAB subunit AddB [Clostridia bacterium]|nr:helicase-exonuclease AddAB subunit AddB [Clostridia bacterium]